MTLLRAGAGQTVEERVRGDAYFFSLLLAPAHSVVREAETRQSKWGQGKQASKEWLSLSAASQACT